MDDFITELRPYVNDDILRVLKWLEFTLPSEIIMISYLILGISLLPVLSPTFTHIDILSLSVSRITDKATL